MTTLTHLREKLAEHEANVAALVEAANVAVKMCDLVDSDEPGVVPHTKRILERAIAPFVSPGDVPRHPVDEIYLPRFRDKQPVEYCWHTRDNERIWKPGVIAAPDRGGALVSVRPDGSETAFNVHRNNVRSLRVVPAPVPRTLDRATNMDWRGE